MNLLTGKPMAAIASATIAALLLASSAHAACDGLSSRQYQALRTGMTPAQADAAVGCPGFEATSNEIMGIQTVLREWEGAGDSPLWLLQAIFENGKLQSKTQIARQ